MEILKLTERMYRLAGKLNLHISADIQSFDIYRIEKAIKEIETLVAEIESELLRLKIFMKK